MHVSSYTLNGWLKGDMQLHTEKKGLVLKSAVRCGRNRSYLYITTGRC